jgi:hypothetical protein
VEFSHCHCEEGQNGRRGNPSCSGRANGVGGSVAEGQWIATPQGARDDKRELRDGAVRLLRVSGSPRAFSPRDDNTLCHCEKDRMDDAAIHRISKVDGRVGGSFTGSQWIATGYALAMTRWGKRYSRMRIYAGASRAWHDPFGPSPPRSIFPFRNVRHPSVHSSPTTAVGNQHGSLCGCRGDRGCCCRA